MKALPSDAKKFVKGIVDHLDKRKTDGQTHKKIKILLEKVSDTAVQDTVAKVTTAVPLTEGEKALIAAYLSRKMQHPVTLSCLVDPDIIAGMRIEIADYIIDTGYKGKLTSIASMLLKGNIL